MKTQVIPSRRPPLRERTRIEDDFQGILGHHFIDLLPRPVIEEILPDKSEMISGCERGEEETPGRGCGIRPAGQIAPRNLLQLSASASNVPTDNPPPATEARPRQEDFFPAAKMGALLLRPLRFRPCWVEEEEGAVEACCCD